MRKKICVQEADEVEIRFKDKIYLATFNMKAVGYMQEALQALKIENLSYEHFAGLTLYAGLRVNHPDITEEEANAMALTMRPSDMSEIIESYVQSVNGVSIAENEEALKKAIAQMLGAKDGR
nr:MAG TPA: tail assembly chaperone protein [Caudoviricetes sp.]